MKERRKKSVLDMNYLIVTASISFAILLRLLVSQYPYSGMGMPPLFGDYEAHRHWMEITVNLPTSEWYKNSSKNDLLYWGLDYPPLAAYHSYVFGKVAKVLNFSWVELERSKGLESKSHKFFMRQTVLITDILVFFPGVLLLFFSLYENGYPVFFPFLILCYADLILIDHGHFQYNCFPIGLSLISFSFLLKGYDRIGSLIFVLALNAKQMVFYYALPVFCFLFFKCLHRKDLKLFAWLAATVVLTFMLIWLPFVCVLSHVLKRIFPLDRGIFEDKVANFWSVINIVIKMKSYSRTSSFLGSLLLTLLTQCYHTYVMYKLHSAKTFLLSLISSSLSFYLFSFQVHEKSILFPAVLSLFLLPSDNDTVIYFLSICHFSLIPLYCKDKIFIISSIVYAIFLILIHIFVLDSNQYGFCLRGRYITVSAVQKCFLFLGILLTACALTIPTPVRFKELWIVILYFYCFVNFFVFYLLVNVRLYYELQYSKSKLH